MSPQVKRALGWSGVILAGLGLIGTGYTFLAGGDAGAQKTPPSIYQTNPYQSPNVFGHGNQFNYNSEPQPWLLTEEQKAKLRSMASKVPAGATYHLRIDVIPQCNTCSMFAEDVASVWADVTGWKLGIWTDYGLSSRMFGVYVASDLPGCSEEEKRLVGETLGAAGVRYDYSPVGGKKEFEPGDCVVFVGNKIPEEAHSR